MNKKPMRSLPRFNPSKKLSDWHKFYRQLNTKPKKGKYRRKS